VVQCVPRHDVYDPYSGTEGYTCSAVDDGVHTCIQPPADNTDDIDEQNGVERTVGDVG